MFARVGLTRRTSRARSAKTSSDLEFLLWVLDLPCAGRVILYAVFMSGEKGCEILFIEDDPDDLFLFNRAFEQSRIPCRIHTVHSVEEAEEYLNGTGRYRDRESFPLPDIIVTDLAFRGQ